MSEDFFETDGPYMITKLPVNQLITVIQKHWYFL